MLKSLAGYSNAPIWQGHEAHGPMTDFRRNFSNLATRAWLAAWLHRAGAPMGAVVSDSAAQPLRNSP